MADSGVRAEERVGRRAGKPWWVSPLQVFIVFLVCHSLARMNQSLPPRSSYPHLIWLMEGANLAAVLLFGFKAWLGILPAQWLAATGLTSRIISVVACAGRLALEQWLLPRFGFNARMDRLRDLVVLFLTSGAVLAANGLLVDGFLLWRTQILPPGQFWLVFRTWWIGDASGVLLVTPMVLLWAVPENRRHLLNRWKELVALSALSLVSSQYFLQNPLVPSYERFPFSFPVNPLMVWAALRMDPVGLTSLGFLIICESLIKNSSTWSTISAANWLGSTPYPVLQIGVTWILGVILGFVMRQLRQAREVLRENHQALSSLVETSPLAIIAVNRERHVLEWNRSATQLFGWSGAEVAGKELPFPVQAGLGDVIAQVLAGDNCSMRREGSFHRDGQGLSLQLEAAPMRDASGSVVAVVILIDDRTVQTQIEGRLQQSQRLEAMGRLAGSIAHDFNHILTVILGQAELLLTRVKEIRLRERIERVHAAALQATTLTSRLLTFSRRQRPESRRVDLNHMVLRLTALLHRIIGEDVKLETDLERALPPVIADPGQLEQILMNLVINARDAMPRGGHLRICTRRERSSGQDAKAPAIVNGIVLAVEDDGAGMPPEVQSRMFDPFFTTRTGTVGTGLGLAIVYGIVRQNGATIRVWSEVDRGTRIEICFPEIEAEKMAEIRRMEARAPAASRST